MTATADRIAAVRAERHRACCHEYWTVAARLARDPSATVDAKKLDATMAEAGKTPDDLSRDVDMLRRRNEILAATEGLPAARAAVPVAEREAEAARVREQQAVREAREVVVAAETRLHNAQTHARQLEELNSVAYGKLHADLVARGFCADFLEGAN